MDPTIYGPSMRARYYILNAKRTLCTVSQGACREQEYSLDNPKNCATPSIPLFGIFIHNKAVQVATKWQATACNHFN